MASVSKSHNRRCGKRGGGLVVSLNVRFAFNSLLFETWKEAFQYHAGPPFLRRLLKAYLHNRVVIWKGEDWRLHQWRDGSIVPQGFSLDPMLWNVGFDWLFCGLLLSGTGVVCF